MSENGVTLVYHSTGDVFVKERYLEPDVTTQRGSIKKNKVSSSSCRSTSPVNQIRSDDQISRDPPSHNMLTMAIIGCLSDNVQQAVKSFSIRQDKQYITFAFPFMEDLTRRFGEILHMPEMGCSSERPHCITPALLFDQCFEVVHGFQTYVTFAPCMNRTGLPIVLLTLYQRDTTEGLKRHFESLIRILLNKTTLLSIWKLPMLVVDLDNNLLDLITDACVHTVMDIQIENLYNTFPGKSTQELFTLVKDKMIRPYLTSYQDLLAVHVQEVVTQLTTTDHHYFQSLVAHLQSVTCTLVDFKKVELFFKSPTCEIPIKEFWKVWGHEQISCKVFPVTVTTRSCHKMGALYYTTPLGGGGLGGNADKSLLVSGPLSHVPIKEGLQSIIKCLKSQDVGQTDSLEDRQSRPRTCYCNVCRFHSLARSKGKVSQDYLGSESAFRRPLPGSRFHQTDMLTTLSRTTFRGSTKSRSNIFPYPQVSLSTVTSTKVEQPFESNVVQPVPHYFNARFGLSMSSSSSSYYRSRILAPQSVFYSDSK